MGDLLVILLVLAFITVVGHLIWLAIAAVVRFVLHDRAWDSAELVREQPARVGLSELDITTRTIRALLARGDLDRETADRLERCLEARRRSLLEKPSVPVAKVRPLTSSPSVAQLEQLLGGGAHPRDLPPSRRQEALACYRRLNNSQQASLNAPTLLALARLLYLAGLTSRALETYRRLLDQHPNLPDHALIALEAGRLAVAANETDLARRFLDMARAGVLTEPDYQESQSLLASLDQPVQAPAAITPAEPEAVLEVIPASRAEVIVRPEPVPQTPPAPITVAPPPRRPRRSLTNLLAAFMEERNILWGELAGGLLIVGCSIALVITLWHSLEELPYFPFLLFASITAALFGAGEYTLHHWKLESTSRGLLVIALLLVPLNLLVLADPSLGHASTALEVTFKAAAVLLSLGMVRLAGRDLIGVGVLPGPVDRRWLFMLAIVGSAGSQLMVPRLLDEQRPALFVTLGCVPVACHLLACGAVVAGLARALAKTEDKRLKLRQANALFVFLGLASFALFVALGFLLSRSGDPARALPHLAVPFALAGVPILAGGLLVRRGLPREDSGPRTAGTAVAIAGLAIMLSAVVLAWPQPQAVLLVCLVNTIILSAIAFHWRMPAAHAVALPCLALAVLIVVQFARGSLPVAPELDLGWRLARQLLSPSSGVTLAVLMVLLAAGAEGLARAGQRLHAVSYALGCGLLGVCALLVTAWHGIESPWPAALVHTLAGGCALALHVRWRRPALPYTGLSLLVAASLWGLWATAPDNRALWGFVLALESSVLALAALRTHPFRPACRELAAISAVLALGLALFTPGFPDQELHTVTAAILALTAFLLAHVLRRPEPAWLGSLLVFAALAHLFIWDVNEGAIARPLLVALLAHATLALLGALLLPARSASDGSPLHAPLSQSAQITSILAVPLLFLPGIVPLVLAEYTFWLAALWLLIGWIQRSPGWFTAFQAALSMAVVCAVRAALPEYEWFDPRGLQGYGIGLGLLGLGWITARAGLSSSQNVRGLWDAPWPSLDRVVLAGLVVGQFALALWGISSGIVTELTPAGHVSLLTWPPDAAHAYGPGAWVLLGVQALVLLAALREKRRASIILGLLVLALTVPLLAAGPFESEQATASALRWGLALCFVVCSALVWLRRSLARLVGAVGVTIAPDSLAVHWTHGLLGVVAAGVLLLTAQVAVLGFAGLRPTGPAPGSLFAEMGWVLSNVGPLVLLTAGLVGHAVRERSPAYAFTAGLVANVSVTGGYALAVVTGGRHLDDAEIACLLQLFSLTAALWALAWQASRRWVHAWREVGGSAAATPLMLSQIGLALVGQLILLVSAVLSLSDLSGRITAWSVVVAASPAWAALLTSLAALFVWYWQRHRPVPWGWQFAGGLAVASLLACTIERTWPGSGYYFLLLCWPIYVLLWSLPPLIVAVLNSTRAPATVPLWFSFDSFRRFAPVILLPCMLSVMLAWNIASLRQEFLWAAASVALSALATALLSTWLRNEKLAFLAGLGANLATSLGVCHFYPPQSPPWLSLVQANAIASSSVALVWLGIRRFLPQKRPGPLLTIQAVLGLVIHTLVLLLPLVRLDGYPARPPGPFVADIGSPAGWAALLLSATAAFWHFAVSRPRGCLHVLGIAGLSAGVLAACSASPWDTGNWLSFHVLLLSWCVLGLAATAIGSVTFSLRVAGLTSPTSGEMHARRFVAVFRPRELRRWLEGIGIAILVLALPTAGLDPWRPWSSAAAVLVVSLMATILALWSRRQRYVWISGLLVDLVGLLLWWSWGPGTAISFTLMNAFGLAVAAAFWTVMDLALPASTAGEGTPASARSVAWLTRPTFAHFAANFALALLVLVVVVLLASDLQPPRIAVSRPFVWTVLAAVGGALTLILWDRRARFAPPALYGLGLTAIGLALHDLTPSPVDLGWSAALALGGYAIFASAIACIFKRSQEDWFPPAQAVVACGVIALSLWMCLDFATAAERLAGPAAVALLIPAAVMLIGRAGFVENGVRPVSLVLGALAAAEIGWACPDPASPTAWLHRNVLLMVALVAMTALYGVALPRWLARDPEWVRWGRRFGPALGVLASLTLLVLLVQEFRLYDPLTRRTPMAWPEVLVVLAALLMLMVSGIRFAVVPGRDPFGLSERGRSLYIYAVELLLVLLFVHLRLTVPELFRGWLTRYWTFVVMLIAFLGVGLSEFFERRKLRVLAEPLQRTGVFLPLLPLLAFWVRPAAPNLPPLLAELHKPLQTFNSYAFLWLLVCGLYALVSLTRRSFVFALLAALAANFALWSLLTHHGIAFLLHPQCWLIPLAAIVLAAEHINRDRLGPELSAGLRYLGICMIYVSSTADLFIAGLGNSVMLPIVLAILSLAGVLAGILFRVRAFLFLGISFLFLDVFTMIWYAAVDRYQTWLWWVSGIVLGAAILTLFAVFEKRRNDVLHLLEEIKQWD
jgi:hypothetical protein